MIFQNTAFDDIKINTESTEYNSCATSLSPSTVPKRKKLKMLFQDDLDVIARRLALLVYTSTISLPDDDYGKLILKDLAEDITEIAVRAGIVKQVQFYLKLLTSNKIVIDTNNSGTVEIFREEEKQL